MSNMFQLFEMMAVPAVFFLTCRSINRRRNRTAAAPDPVVGEASSARVSRRIKIA